jgi:transcriptional regulator with XRE-family HTH domain
LTPPPLLVRALSEIGIALEELAQRTGISPARLLQLKYGRGGPANGFEQETIAAAFGESPEILFAEEAVSRAAPSLNPGRRPESGTMPAKLAPLGTPARLPVYKPLPSTKTGWHAAQFILAERREPPPCLRDADGAYGVFVDGQGQPPFFMPGELYWVHPGRPVLHRSRVLARLADGTAAPGMIEYEGEARLLSVGRQTLRLDAAARLERIVVVEAG